MGKTAFVFAGQGAQTPGMGADLYAEKSTAKKYFDMLSDELKSLIFNGPGEELSKTINAQPAIFAMNLACAELLTENGVKPDGLAGFSFGEVTALVYAKTLSITDGLEYTLKRAEYMQVASNNTSSGMLTVLKLQPEKIEDICNETGKAWPANYNSEEQTVVAFDKTNELELTEKLKEAGGRVMPLSVSGAFHSPIMESAASNALEYLSKISLKSPEYPVYANLTAFPYTDDVAKYMSEQIKSPVLWFKTIQNMITDGYDTFIEAGPGKTLTGLIKRVNKDVRLFNVNSVSSLEETLQNL